MAIIHRRVFFAKVGTAEQLVQHLREGEEFLQRQGVDFKGRLLTDYMSGRSDSVAAEWEVNDLADLDPSLNRVMSNPDAQALFQGWMAKLEEMIDYSEAENWTVR